jgi:hypothetical protein
VPTTPSLSVEGPHTGRLEKIPRLLDLALAGPKLDLKGVDLINVESSLSLYNLSDGAVVATVESPDEILNAGGFLRFDVTALSARNGSIDLAIAVNGQTLRNVSCQLLVPDSMHFSRRLDVEFKFFRSVSGSPATH